MRFTVTGLGHGRWRNEHYSELITAAAHDHFKITAPPPKGEGPAAYLVGGYLRVVYDELIVQFDHRVPPARCSAILEETGFREVERRGFAESKWIVRHARTGVVGESLLAAADKFVRFAEVQFAWPYSVAEYVKASPAPQTQDWWLEKIGVILNGGRPLGMGNSDVKIAVLDDGVDITHPNLAGRVAAGLGRNYAVAVNHPDHLDPMPKVKKPLGTPDEYSDFHGTACAGIICSDGSQAQFLGVAPGCKLVPVRVIDGPALINESWLADAIEYATGKAEIISCAWGGPDHGDVVTALNNTALARGGKGVAVFCAAGNEGKLVINFPAWHECVIAVGACTYKDGRPQYANIGEDLDIVAPSSGSGAFVFTTDVPGPGWGYNPVGTPAGLFHAQFSGTSAATAIAAGVGALCFSKNPNLTVDGLRNILQGNAVQIGVQDGIVYTLNHSLEFGYGRIDAAATVAAA